MMRGHVFGVAFYAQMLSYGFGKRMGPTRGFALSLAYKSPFSFLRALVSVVVDDITLQFQFGFSYKEHRRS